MILHGIWRVLFRSCSQLLSALSRNLNRNTGDSLTGIQQIPLMNYSLNRIRWISSCRLLFGGFRLSSDERVQIEKDADCEEDAAKAHKEHEGNWAMTQEAQTLNHKTENQYDSGKL
jgi:hypothetical protein